MKIEIWSDVVCPFCYIGKRRFEEALAQFPHREDIEVTWKSFLLDPSMVTRPGRNLNQHLADIKGWSPEQARAANEYVTRMAQDSGLDYQLDSAIPANSKKAHRLIQLARHHGQASKMEESLFKAYFTEGRNIDDDETLIEIAVAAGLDMQESKQVIHSDQFADAVERDIYEARQIGVKGVPYFVFNDRYAVSGAQPAGTFLGALETAWKEWKHEQQPPLRELPGKGTVSCDVTGNC